jgi:hypothetical protein
MKKLFLFTMLPLITFAICNAQVNIDSLFLSSDSLTLIYTGFLDEEVENMGFKQVFCHESAYHYSTNSHDLITRTLNHLNFKASNNVLFCGYDYEIYGYKQQEKVFTMLYNSDCNYGSIESEHFWTDTLRQFNGLKEYIRFTDTICEFRTTELADCYVESLKVDERIKLISIKRMGDLELFYRITLKNQ